MERLQGGVGKLAAAGCWCGATRACRGRARCRQKSLMDLRTNHPVLHLRGRSERQFRHPEPAEPCPPGSAGFLCCAAALPRAWVRKVPGSAAQIGPGRLPWGGTTTGTWSQTRCPWVSSDRALRRGVARFSPLAHEAACARPRHGTRLGQRLGRERPPADPCLTPPRPTRSLRQSSFFRSDSRLTFTDHHRAHSTLVRWE